MRSVAFANHGGKQAPYAEARRFGETDIRAVLPSIRAPTLVLHRTDNPEEPVEAGRYLGTRIPGARFVQLDGADDFAASLTSRVRIAPVTSRPSSQTRSCSSKLMRSSPGGALPAASATARYIAPVSR